MLNKQSVRWQEFLAIAIPGIIGFLVAVAISWSRWPVPSIHDDFGNLLVASTLLEGRFSNPVPDAWQSMETFHVVFQPSYASKFPIGLGLMLAMGYVLTGTYVAGLWMCAAVACSSVVWMINSHFPRRWGLTAGLFTAIHPVWQTTWSQEFTNGWLALAGVSLVFGGLLRIRRNYRAELHVAANPFDGRLTAIVGLGCVMALFSRPFEGGIVCGLLAMYFLPAFLHRHLFYSRSFYRAALPGAAVLASGICLQLVINHAITGNCLQLPYQLHESQYGVAPVLIWQTPQEPTLGHRFAEQAKFHRGWSMDEFRKAASFSGYFDLLRKRTGFAINHWGHLLAFSPAFLLVLSQERRRFIGLIGLLLIAFLVINCIPWAMPLYVSPLIPFALFLACAATRGMVKRFASCFPSGLKTARMETAVLVSIIVFNSCNTWSLAADRARNAEGWERKMAEQRMAMMRYLEKQSGDDLIFVKYPPTHNVHCEWVFNEANLGRSPAVWVRWGAADMNRRVLDSFAGRRVWLLEFGGDGEPTLREPLPSDLSQR